MPNSLSLSLSIYLSIYLSISLSIYLSLSLSLVERAFAKLSTRLIYNLIHSADKLGRSDLSGNLSVNLILGAGLMNLLYHSIVVFLFLFLFEQIH